MGTQLGPTSSAALVVVTALLLVSTACGQKPPVAPPDAGTSVPSEDGGGRSDGGEDGELDGGSEGGADSDAGTDAGGAAPLSLEGLTALTTHLASDQMDGRNEGTAGHDLARDFIVEKLGACGVQPVNGNAFLQPITTGVGDNIVGRIEGTDAALKSRHIIISAHYDHLGSCGGQICNGANDNAAGVAAIIGVGCALAQAPLARSVLIAAWDAEEPPTFLTGAMGSAFYVANPLVPLAQTDVAVVLDLVGSQLWPGLGAHFVLGAELSPQVGAALSSVGTPANLPLLSGGLHLIEQTPYGQQPWSDYDAFRDASVPVLFLSDGQNKRYHTPADEVSGLDFPKLHAETLFLMELVTALGNAATTPTFDAAGANHARDADTVVTVLEAALAPGGMVDQLALSATSAGKLQTDLDAANAVKQKIADGQPLTQTDLGALRRGTQRVMCLAGSTYPQIACQAL